MPVNVGSSLLKSYPPARRRLEGGAFEPPRCICLSRKSGVRIRRGEDLPHQPADVAVLGEPVELPARPGPALDQVGEPHELVLAAQFPRVLAEVLDDAEGHLLRGDLQALVEVDQLSLDPDQRRANLVVVDQLVRVVDARQALVVEGIEAMGQRQREGGESNRALDPRLLVEDTELDRAEIRVGAHVPPQVGVVLDRPALHHLLDAVGVGLPAAVVRRDPHPWEGAEDRRSGRHHAGHLALPEGRVGRHPEQQRQVAAHAVSDVDRLLGVVDPDVDVGPEDHLLVGDPPELRRELPVAGLVDDPLVLVVGGGMRAGGADGEVVARAHLADAAPHVRELRSRLGDVRAGPGRHLQDRLHQLGLHLAGEILGQVPEDRVDPLGQLESLGIADHQLLLDADGEARLAEFVFQHAGHDDTTRGCRPPVAGGRQNGRVVLDQLEHPIVLAPLAGGSSTPELTAAVSSAGALGFLASGYLSTEALEERTTRVRELTDAPYGVNLFVPGEPDAVAPGLEDYLGEVAPEAGRYGASLGEARYDDDSYFEKLALVDSMRPAVVSFTFGCPEPERIDALKGAGIEVWVTATSPQEARVAAGAGADGVVLQGAEAGGHRGSFADSDEEPLSTLVLLRLVARRIRLPLIASGGLSDGPSVAAVLTAGAAAAQLGTAFLGADEAGTEPSYRKALRTGTPTALTRAFSGRRARGIVNRFMSEHSESAPAAYPHIHYATSPLRAAARKLGDPDGFNLWAGQAHELAPHGPAAEIVRSISEDARRALEAAANRVL